VSEPQHSIRVLCVMTFGERDILEAVRIALYYTNVFLMFLLTICNWQLLLILILTMFNFRLLYS
jgi:hypothetical protein